MMAEKAVELLTPGGDSALYPVELIVRQSTARRPAA